MSTVQELYQQSLLAQEGQKGAASQYLFESPCPSPFLIQFVRLLVVHGDTCDKRNRQNICQ